MPPTVLITGASTGIGEATARRMAHAGWRVFAGVRRDADADHVSTLGAEPLHLDVTDTASIDAAVATLTEAVGAEGLRGLVNNAGVAGGGPIEYLPLDAWRDQFEVNVLGPVALTRATMPLLRRATGRVVFVGSTSGRVSTVLMGPYGASKHAIEAISESLRHELKPWGMRSIVVEPGAVKTAIWAKGRALADELERRLPAEARERYAPHIAAIRKGIEGSERSSIDPDRVARVIERALIAPRPRARYLVGPDAWLVGALDRFLPDTIRDAIVGRVVGP